MGSRGSSVPSSALKFRLVKSLDIAYLTFIYFIFGVGLSMPIDQALGKFDSVEAEKKGMPRLLFEVAMHVAFLGIIIYIVRNVVERIPSPFDGVAGLQHNKLKELGSASVFVFFLMFYQKNLVDRMNYIHHRINNALH